MRSVRRDSDNDSTSSEKTDISWKRVQFVSVPTVSVEVISSTPDLSEENRSIQRPKDLMIPELVVQTPSPTRARYPIYIPGSPPPQRSSVGETSFPSKDQQKRLMMQFDKPGSLDIPFLPPMITITTSMSEAEYDNDFLSTPTVKSSPNKLLSSNNGMTYLSPFSTSRGERVPSEGNLSSSGYSSMAYESPAPSRCTSNSKLCANDIELTLQMPTSNNQRRFQSILKKPDDKDSIENYCFRKRSDSETLSDETLLESNDEGIDTDHIDEKIEDGDIKSARDLEVFISKELLEVGKNILSADEQSLTIPSIIIQTEPGFEKRSPVSSRSESPLSDRNIGVARFSPSFYGSKSFPFTDSDELYDFPSSDGKAGSTLSTQLKKCAEKRKERKNSKSCKIFYFQCYLNLSKTSVFSYVIF